MKTITDIKQDLENLNNETKHFSKENAKKAFELFDSIPEIASLLTDLENMRNGEYSIEESGLLFYSIEVPKHIADLPFINDYLTQDYFNLTGHRHNGLRLSQCCGEYISVAWNHGRNSYFVYDSELGHGIIDNQEEWMDEKYVAAKIELHQKQRGVYNHSIRTCPRYGSYEEHFDTFKALGTQTELSELELLTIINDYEDKANSEEE